MSSFGPYESAKTRSPSLRYQLHSVEGRAKSPTVPQRRELMIGTHTARQGSTQVSTVICLFKCLKNFYRAACNADAVL